MFCILSTAHFVFLLFFPSIFLFAAVFHSPYIAFILRPQSHIFLSLLFQSFSVPISLCR